MYASPTEASLRLWRAVVGRPDVLAPGSREVVHGTTGLCPPGWTGVLRLGDAFLVEAGAADDDALGMLLGLADPSDPEVVAPLVRGDTLGPGQLAYLPDGAAAPAAPGGGVEDPDPDELGDWLARQRPEDVGESDAAAFTRRFVVRRERRIAGVAGWTEWPTSVAHLGVLVDPDHRGTGVGTTLGQAAAGAAVRAGLSPQWRAAAWNVPSRRIAARIGLVEVGRQYSVEGLAAGDPSR